MRLIDADPLKEKAFFHEIDNVSYVEEEEVDKAPTVDAVEVVRCKDCTYWNEAKVNSKGFLICPASGMEIFEIDYCSYGERREDGHD